MRSLVVAAVLVASSASLAFAQAPGETDLAPAAPIAVTRHVDVMANRWSVGFSAGGIGLQAKDSNNAPTQFGIGELALRYRLGLHLELEVSAGGGSESTRDDGTNSHLQVSEGVLAARYHFRPTRPWSWYLSAGVGALTVASKDATDQERQDATRALGEFGVGIERRFHHLALQAEFRAVGVGATKASQGDMTAPVAKNSTTMTPAQTTELQNSDPSASGAQVTFGASYYF